MRLLLPLIFLTTVLRAAPLKVTVHTPDPPRTDAFTMGTARAPNGDTLTLDSRSLLLNGRRWTPVMGEFHFSRYPADEWRQELLKMKAGGIDIVSTYVFWIHHEEVEGRWNWEGNKSLREFIRTAGEVGLKAIVRCGPWSHGEVRNGGLPDWIVARGDVRSLDPAFIASTTELYRQIAAQLGGLLWKDGGPVIGIQLDNEYGGPAEYLLALKGIARDAGLDVPLYTRTGWPALSTPIPFGEIIPLYGVYAEGFWDRETTSMPGRYWIGFHFSTQRIDANIASDALGLHDTRDPEDAARYPYLTCEIGGGMMSSYHRRILVDPRDVEATTLVKIGSGSVSPGYYMYHGGTNPDGERTTLMETQDSALTNWNDMPVKNYDFQAPLGQFGQVRSQFYELRLLHSFLHSFGTRLAAMDAFLPEQRPVGKDDVTTLRWVVRSDGISGFVFVNNYERGRHLPSKDGVQFAVDTAAGGTLVFPATPVTVPSDVSFFWPFNLDVGQGITLAWATAQPVRIDDSESGKTLWFAATPGIRAQFCMMPDGAPLTANSDAAQGGEPNIFDLEPGKNATVSLDSGGRTYTIRIAVLPHAKPLKTTSTAVQFAKVRDAGPPRVVPLAGTKQPVAEAPKDSDFDAAASWKIELPRGVDTSADQMLRIAYVGDVARVYIGGRFIMDDFYNGNPLEIGVSRYAEALKQGDLTVAILPLRKDAISGDRPLIYMADASKPAFSDGDSIADIRSVELVPIPPVDSNDYSQ